MNELQDTHHQPLLASSSFPQDVSLSFSTNLSCDNLLAFFQRVHPIQDEIRCLDQSLRRLQRCTVQSKQSHTSQSAKALAAQMKSDMDDSLKQARSIKESLACLDEANAESQSIAGCEKGSSVNRIRMFVTNSLRQNLHALMAEFGSLASSMEEDQSDLITRRYFALTGKQPTKEVVDYITETGDSEDLLRKAIEQQGIAPNGHIIQEIHERQAAVKSLENDLTLLHQLFLDMSVLVEDQGEGLDDIEKNMLESVSFVKLGIDKLDEASRVNRNTRKWVIGSLVSLLVLITAITILVVIFVVYR